MFLLTLMERVEECGELVSVCLNNFQKKPFTVKKDIYNRLLNTLTQRGESPSLIYSLLSRYNALEGLGFQAGVPDAVFDALVKHVSVTTECFASPLNNYLDRYCSAFPDIDCAFGSLGSFFNLEIIEGSFQANPPFTQTIMDRAYKKIHDALTNPLSGALSFAVIVPAWRLEVAWNNLISSPFNKMVVNVPALEHGYKNGGFRVNKYFAAQYDTSVVFLQNDLGSKRWPLTEECSSDIVSAFREGLPSIDVIKGIQMRGVYVPKSQREKR